MPRKCTQRKPYKLQCDLPPAWLYALRLRICLEASTLIPIKPKLNMSTTSPITKQQSIPTTEAPTSLVFSPQLPQSPLEPFSPQSPSSAGSGMCSPLSLQSPVHDSTDALSARNGGSNEEVTAYHGYVARRSAILKRWKDRKSITVITGMLFVHA